MDSLSTPYYVAVRTSLPYAYIQELLPIKTSSALTLDDVLILLVNTVDDMSKLGTSLSNLFNPDDFFAIRGAIRNIELCLAEIEESKEFMIKYHDLCAAPVVVPRWKPSEFGSYVARKELKPKEMCKYIDVLAKMIILDMLLVEEMPSLNLIKSHIVHWIFPRFQDLRRYYITENEKLQHSEPAAWDELYSSVGVQYKRGTFNRSGPERIISLECCVHQDTRVMLTMVLYRHVNYVRVVDMHMDGILSLTYYFGKITCGIYDRTLLRYIVDLVVNI